MNIVELFSGTSNLSNEFRRRGHNVIDIDWDEKTPAKLHCDISKLTFEDLENMFEDKHIDFIFGAPDIYCKMAKTSYDKTKSIDECLWENILNKCNCKFIIENPSPFIYKDYMTDKYGFDLHYNKLDTQSIRIAHYSTNCKGLDKYIKDNIKPLKNESKTNFNHRLGETPHQLIPLIADFIEKGE